MTKKEKIERLRKFTPDKFYDYIKENLKNKQDLDIESKYALESSIGLIDNDLTTKKSSEQHIKEKFKRQNQAVFDEVLDNIEKTMDGQPIYREINICIDKKDENADLEKIKDRIKEPIGSSWAYIPLTKSYRHTSCEKSSEESRSFLLKAKVLDSDAIDIDSSLLVNLNWTQKESGGMLEHEIVLKNGAKVEIEDICEKYPLGSKQDILFQHGFYLTKQCLKINQKFNN